MRPEKDNNLQVFGEHNETISSRVETIEISDAIQSLIDETDPNNIYVCKAHCGAIADSPAWQIKLITVVGAITTIKWAEGDSTFTHNANDRATLEYK